MRICVIGAGAIGSLLAGKLSNAGHEVDILARGSHLEAIREIGLRIIQEDGREVHVDTLNAAEEVSAFGEEELIILAVKAHQIIDVVPQIRPLLGTDTVIMTVQNGIPWWFFHGFDGPYQGRIIRAVDPDGRIAQHVDSRRVLGSIAYPAADRPEPGLVRVVEGDQFPVGELDGLRSRRATEVASVLATAGFRSRVLTDIRSHIWVKAWGNLAFNPISALTGATLSEICRNPLTRALATEMMTEASAIADPLGIRTRITIAQRIEAAERIGDHKTSMLQDLEAARELETEALIGSFVELGELIGTPTPSIDAVYACVKLLEAVQKSMRD
jgi:2-dehydropantoate 2-reductase